jgi:hypothetical protein
MHLDLIDRTAANFTSNADGIWPGSRQISGERFRCPFVSATESLEFMQLPIGRGCLWLAELSLDCRRDLVW